MTTNNIFYKECCDKFIDYVKKSHNEQDLTEQWKKGELEVGWYYITTTFTDGVLMEWFDGDEFRTVFTCNVKEVLAPVPSFEEWQQMKEQRDACAWALDKIGDVLVKHNLVKK